MYIYRCIWIVCWAAQLWFQSWFLFRFFNQQVDAAYTGLLQIYLCLGQEDLVVHFHIASLPKIFSCSVIGQPEDCRLRPGHDLQVINCWRRPRPTGALSWFDFAIRLAAASSDFRHFHPIFAGSHSTQATKASRPLDVGVIMAPNYDHPENTKIYNKRRVSEQKYSPQEIIHQPSFIN